jgi:hypothetical protein
MDTRLEKACTYLITKAYPSYNKDTCGNCAAFVRSAFDFGFGVSVKKFPSAKDCAPAYEALGFKKVFSFPEQRKEDYKPELGDVAIIQYLPHGHICVFTAEGWISDFKQVTGGSKLPLAAMYGGKIRDKNPPFVIYRLAYKPKF